MKQHAKSTAPDRVARGRWAPGKSGNPAGRPPGSGRVAKLRQGIEKHLPDILARLVDQALGGDTTAARLLLERCLPPLKAAELPEPLPLAGDTLTAQGRSVVAAVAAGELSAGQAAQLLAGLAALAKIVETDELAARLDELERQA